MAALGRPTPQPRREHGEGPRYHDKDVSEFASPNANPYVTSHRTFGRPVLTGAEAWGVGYDWTAEFDRDAPLHLEIGSGNGFFLAGMAARHTDWNFVGVELRYKRVILCATKLRKQGSSNARIARYHAAYLDDLFQPDTLSGIYINHPDPWPKERHDKNRLISRWFLEDACRLLKPGGWLRLKSDHLPNITRVAELLAADSEGNPLPALPLRIVGTADDVTTGPAPWPDDIETNYQKKFRERGLPVYALEAVRTEGEVIGPNPWERAQPDGHPGSSED